MVPQEGFMEALKAFIKLLEAPHRSVKIKILVNFLSSFSIETGRVIEKLTYPGENDRLVNCVKIFLSLSQTNLFWFSTFLIGWSLTVMLTFLLS